MEAIPLFRVTSSVQINTFPRKTGIWRPVSFPAAGCFPPEQGLVIMFQNHTPKKIPFECFDVTFHLSVTPHRSHTARYSLCYYILLKGLGICN